MALTATYCLLYSFFPSLITCKCSLEAEGRGGKETNSHRSQLLLQLPSDAELPLKSQSFRLPIDRRHVEPSAGEQHTEDVTLVCWHAPGVLKQEVHYSATY